MTDRNGAHRPGDHVLYVGEGGTVSALVLEERDGDRYLLWVMLWAGSTAGWSAGQIARQDQLVAGVADAVTGIETCRSVEVDGSTLTSTAGGARVRLLKLCQRQVRCEQERHAHQECPRLSTQAKRVGMSNFWTQVTGSEGDNGSAGFTSASWGMHVLIELAVALHTIEVTKWKN